MRAPHDPRPLLRPRLGGGGKLSTTVRPLGGLGAMAFSRGILAQYGLDTGADRYPLAQLVLREEQGQEQAQQMQQVQLTQMTLKLILQLNEYHLTQQTVRQNPAQTGTMEYRVMMESLKHCLATLQIRDRETGRALGERVQTIMALTASAMPREQARERLVRIGQTLRGELLRTEFRREILEQGAHVPVVWDLKSSQGIRHRRPGQAAETSIGSREHRAELWKILERLPAQAQREVWNLVKPVELVPRTTPRLEQPEERIRRTGELRTGAELEREIFSQEHSRREYDRKSKVPRDSREHQVRREVRLIQRDLRLTNRTVEVLRRERTEQEFHRLESRTQVHAPPRDGGRGERRTVPTDNPPKPGGRETLPERERTTAESAQRTQEGTIREALRQQILASSHREYIRLLERLEQTLETKRLENAPGTAEVQPGENGPDARTLRLLRQAEPMLTQIRQTMGQTQNGWEITTGRTVEQNAQAEAALLTLAERSGAFQGWTPGLSPGPPGEPVTKLLRERSHIELETFARWVQVQQELVIRKGEHSGGEKTEKQTREQEKVPGGTQIQMLGEFLTRTRQKRRQELLQLVAQMPEREITRLVTLVESKRPEPGTAPGEQTRAGLLREKIGTLATILEESAERETLVRQMAQTMERISERWRIRARTGVDRVRENRTRERLEIRMEQFTQARWEDHIRAREMLTEGLSLGEQERLLTYLTGNRAQEAKAEGVTPSKARSELERGPEESTPQTNREIQSTRERLERILTAKTWEEFRAVQRRLETWLVRETVRGKPEDRSTEPLQAAERRRQEEKNRRILRETLVHGDRPPREIRRVETQWRKLIGRVERNETLRRSIQVRETAVRTPGTEIRTMVPGVPGQRMQDQAVPPARGRTERERIPAQMPQVRETVVQKPGTEIQTVVQDIPGRNIQARKKETQTAQARPEGPERVFRKEDPPAAEVRKEQSESPGEKSWTAEKPVPEVRAREIVGKDGPIRQEHRENTWDRVERPVLELQKGDSPEQREKQTVLPEGLREIRTQRPEWMRTIPEPVLRSQIRRMLEEEQRPLGRTGPGVGPQGIQPGALGQRSEAQPESAGWQGSRRSTGLKLANQVRAVGPWTVSRERLPAMGMREHQPLGPQTHWEPGRGVSGTGRASKNPGAPAAYYPMAGQNLALRQEKEPPQAQETRKTVKEVALAVQTQAPELQQLQQRTREQRQTALEQEKQIGTLKQQMEQQEQRLRQVLEKTPAAPAEDPAQVKKLARAVMKELEGQLRLERQRRGM